MVVYKRIFGLVLVLLALFTASAWALNISGNIDGILSPNNNPYNVVGNLRVPPFDTLLIEPGCYFNFTGHYKFIVDTNATLIAEGTETDSIYFTASNITIGWFGLRFFNADTNCHLAYCILKHSKNPAHSPYPFDNGGAISGSFSNLQLNHCRISSNRAEFGCGGGIYWEHGNLSLLNSIITDDSSDFGGSGIYGYADSVSIHGCLFYNDITYYPLGGDMGGAIALENCPQVEITNS